MFRTWSADHGREPGTPYLTPLAQFGTSCSEGRVCASRCRLAPADGSLKTSRADMCPRHHIWSL